MNLKHFYDENEERELLRTPFNIGNETIATNGHILIAIPIDNKYSPVDDMTFKKGVEQILAWRTGPSFEAAPAFEMPESTTCHYCKGTEKYEAIDCLECDGEGEVEFDTAYNFYSCECKSCGGDGYTRLTTTDKHCPHCVGGKRYQHQSRISVLGMDVDANYLERIRTLPDLQIAKSESGKSLLFKSGDASGLIMRLRKIEEPYTLPKEGAVDE